MTKKDKTAENVVFRGFIYFFWFYNKCWGEEIFFPHPIFA